MGPEEIDQRFERTLTRDYDDDAAWEAVSKLHLTGAVRCTNGPLGGASQATL
jgi:hypothetical protein